MSSGPGLDRRTRLLLILSIVVLAGFSAYRMWLAPPPGPYVVFSGRTMGTTYDVKLASRDLGPQAQRKVAATIEARLERVNRLMSSYDPASEISRFNDAESSDPFEISRETLAVLLASQEVSEISGGAFDVTVGPLVEAWGFGSSSPPPRPPGEEELSELRSRVGFRNLVIDPRSRTVRKKNPLSRVDLSAIAKGYGVDQVAEALEELGYHDYLVEVGGELRAAGRKLDETPWRVAIERPDGGLRTIHEVIALTDRAMATSGDYRNYYESEDGERLSHTIDPRTGHPIRHHLASVTVLHRRTMLADALATALDVLGPKQGYALAVREGWAAYFIVRQPSGDFSSRATPAFEPSLDAPTPAGGAPRPRAGP